MVENNTKQQLIMIVTDTLPGDLNYSKLENLRFVGSFVRKGLWAELDLNGAVSKETIWSYLLNGTTVYPTENSLMVEILQNNNKPIYIFDPPVPIAHPAVKSTDKIGQILEQDDWQLIIINSPSGIPQSAGVNISPDDWQSWDDHIGGLTKVADYNPIILVLAIADKDQGKSWIFTGGSKIASLGNPGPVNILDIAPTILWILDIDIPQSMEGRIMNEILDTGMDFTAEEMDLLTDHLRGLGYLG